MKDKNKLVSVVIPVYNREKTIFSSVMSVLNQSYRNLELIVVDDGSSDGTVHILQKIEDKRLKVFRNSGNKGGNYSRNRGVALAHGEYIAFQDSDDIWKSRKLEKCIEIIERENVDFVFSGMIKYGRNYRRYLPTYNLNEYEDKYRQVLKQNCMSTQTLFGKRKCFEKVKFDEMQKKLQDWDLLIRLVQKFSVYYIDEALVDVFMQEDSITITQNTVSAYMRIYEKHKGYIKRHKDVELSFMLNMGNAAEMGGGSGKDFFKDAYYLHKNPETFCYYMLSSFSMFKLYLYVKGLLRNVFSKFHLWKS